MAGVYDEGESGGAGMIWKTYRGGCEETAQTSTHGERWGRMFVRRRAMGRWGDGAVGVNFRDCSRLWFGAGGGGEGELRNATSAIAKHVTVMNRDRNGWSFSSCPMSWPLLIDPLSLLTVRVDTWRSPTDAHCFCSLQTPTLQG